MTIGDHLVERKELKQVEREGLKEGFMVTHHIKSITWINQIKGNSSKYQD